MNDNKRLSDTVRFQIIAAEATFVSAATAWEIATKFRLGKLPEAAAFAHELPARIEAVAGGAGGELPCPLCEARRLHGACDRGQQDAQARVPDRRRPTQ